MKGLTHFDLENQAILKNIAKELHELNETLSGIYDTIKEEHIKIEIEEMPTDFTVEQG